MSSYSQWLRDLSFIIQNDVQLDLSKMHVQFNIVGYSKDSPKLARIKVYNLKKETVTAIEKGGQLYLSAGYVQQIGLVFSGQIVQTRKGRENGCDTYVEILATDSDDFHRTAYISKSFEPGRNLQQHTMEMVASATGQKVDPNLIVLNSATSASSLPRGYVEHGRLVDRLDVKGQTMAADWNFEDGKFSMVAQNAVLNIPLIVVNYKTGMVGIPTQLPDGIHVRMLLNPNVVRNGALQLNNDAIYMAEAGLNVNGTINEKTIGGTALPQLNNSGQNNDSVNSGTDGIYKVICVNVLGDTRGQNWYTDAICSNTITNGGKQYQVDVS